MTPLLFLTLLIFILALLSIWLIKNRIKRKRYLSAIGFTFQTFSITCVLLLTVLLLSNLYIYDRLQFEREIANVKIEKIADQHFSVKLELSGKVAVNADYPEVELKGDEWQLDARIIKWKGWANLIGMDSFFLLERLSGRYSDIQQANQSTQSAYSLIGDEPGLNIWKIKGLLNSRLPFVDAYYGHSVYLPMIDQAVFTVSIGQSGLLVRPANPVAVEAIEDW